MYHIYKTAVKMTK